MTEDGLNKEDKEQFGKLLKKANVPQLLLMGSNVIAETERKLKIQTGETHGKR